MTMRRVAMLAGLALIVIAIALIGLRRGVPWGRTAGAGRGDAARGAKLWETLPCLSCHDVSRPWPGGDICPNLGNVATEAARIVKSADYHGHAKDAEGYIRESILDPNAYIVPGASYRQADGQSVMPKTFAQTLSRSDLDDLVAYLLTQK